MKAKLRSSGFTLAALLSLVLLAPCAMAYYPAGYIELNFSTSNLPVGISLHGNAIIADDGSGENDCVHLTDAYPGSAGHLRIPSLGEGMNVTRLNMSWVTRIGGGSGADGLSLSWGTDLPKTPGNGKPGEEGAGSGLRVTIDTFLNDSPDIVGLQMVWKTNVVASLELPASSLRPDTFVSTSLTVDTNGFASFNYYGYELAAQLAGWSGITKGDMIFSARTGGYEDNHWIDDLTVDAVGVMPGAYTGIFAVAERAEWEHTNSGAINLDIKPGGAYSGSLLMGVTKAPFTGRFDPFTRTSHAQATLPGGLLTDIDIFFQANDRLRGVVSNSQWQANIEAYRRPWEKRWRPATDNVGQYVFAIPSVEGGPGGAGYGTLTVDLLGGVKFAGVLGDGSKVVQKTFLTLGGNWAIYLPTHGGRGSVQGWTAVLNSGLTINEMLWFKTAGIPGPIYPEGFRLYTPTSVLPYTPPAPGQRVLPYFFGVARFDYDGNTFSSDFGLTIKNQFVDLGEDGLSIKFAPKTGLFTGSINVDNTKLKFGGVLFPPEGGIGNFLGPDKTGAVHLGPIPD